MKLTVLRAIPVTHRHATIASATVCALVLATLTGISSAAVAPTVTATLGSHGAAIVGPTDWRSGPIRIAASTRLPDQELVLLHFRPGYGYNRFQADGIRAHGHTASARSALARIFANTIFDGGVDVFPSRSATFSVNVHRGTYYLGELLQRPELTAIHVAGPTATTALAHASLVTETDSRYRLPADLPAHGTLTIHNAGHALHRLNLIPVVQGTTRAQLGAYIRKTHGNDNAPPPSFALEGPQVGTADLSPGHTMQLSYSLPAGRYAVLDFDRDMKTGRPDTLEGMYAVVTLR